MNSPDQNPSQGGARPHNELITTPAQIEKLAAVLKTKKIIAFDTEFIRETTFFPVVEIIQVATDEESWLIDARAFVQGARRDLFSRGGEPHPGLKPLVEVFNDPDILKIAHAIQGDQECLYTSFGFVAKPSLDTAVAASLCGYGDGIGLGNLLKSAMGVTIKKGHARTNWSVRPLPDQLLEYAHADVTHLVRLGEQMLSELDRVGRRSWALEQSAKWESEAIYQMDAESLALKLAKSGKIDKKGYAALVELTQWREERVRQLNLPRRWLADDNVLVDLAQVRPKDLDHLGTFRGLNKGELKNSGEAILAAIRRAAEADLAPVPRGPRPEIPSEAESQVLSLLQCYVGILADQHKIASKHLLVSAQLLPVLRSNAQTVEDLVRDGLMSEGSARLAGGEILAFLHGKRALSVDKNRVKIVPLG